MIETSTRLIDHALRHISAGASSRCAMHHQTRSGAPRNPNRSSGIEELADRVDGEIARE